MLNLGTIFTVALVYLVTSNQGSAIKNRAFEDFLELLKGPKNYDVRKQKNKSLSSFSSSDEDSANNSINGLLKNMEVIDLINKANRNKGTSEFQNRKEKRIYKHSNPVFRNYEVNRHRDSDKQKVLEQIFQDKDTAYSEKLKHKRLTPNNLLSPITLEDDDRHEQTDEGLNEYSKIFVILDPLAIQKSKNQEALSNLVSRILSLSSSTNKKERRERNKSHSYKGFKVKNNLLARRYRRESKESYGGARDSMEEDYKPKRSRNDHGGGGGGGTGGRTAIPYIRQRGDIYERDH